MFGDLDWPLNASRGFVSISWAFCLLFSCGLHVLYFLYLHRLPENCDVAGRIFLPCIREMAAFLRYREEAERDGIVTIDELKILCQYVKYLSTFRRKRKQHMMVIIAGNLRLTKSVADADKPARRDARYTIGSVGFRYIFCSYRKANYTPNTAARGSARDVTSPTTAMRFNSSVFHIVPSEPHPDYWLKYKRDE